MEIKVGDKVRIIKDYPSENGKFGIVVIIPTEDKDGHVFIDRYTNCRIDWETPIEQQIELVEVAHYIPVPKHHKGDIRWVKENAERVGYKEVVVLGNRDSDLQYKCYGEFRYGLKYGEITENDDNDWIRYFTDNELLLEKPSEEEEKPE